MRHYPNDPHWITAKFDGVDRKGLPFKKGDQVFYYPNGREIYAGANAEAAEADFKACAEDEAFMTEIGRASCRERV